ncbi:sigma-54 dependent transcriptional regulator [Halothiobacillus sp.]|uniref:sigma-54 interaction domain-containing protein n=1 Tax=Halothiobacillus sp. TaxID=1891311 RepID=UPI002AD46D93|nr:sigma-54 dependent transcriptional regulator [Halothiobacillus sp.]
MSDHQPSALIAAPPEVEAALRQWLALLGIDGIPRPDAGVPPQSDHLIGGFCYGDHCADCLQGARQLPWVALDPEPGRWLAEEHTPFAALSWPCTLSSLQGVTGRLLSRWRGEQLVAAGRGLVGQSSPMRQLRAEIEQVAPSEATVLILGESGTGKEVVARLIHRLSNRASKPFIPINCGAIPAELLESELFGHEKGAFTGAISARAGRFELAEGGTLFLDEIGDMPLPMQVKILRVLQERTFERVGGRQTMTADVRIIAATHRNLEAHIEVGSFRQDLYYRLNVFPLETLPLRALRTDIPLIIEALARRFSADGRSVGHLTDRALAALAALPWPGNVRELGNVVERLGILYPGQSVDLAQLPEKLLNLLPAEWQAEREAAHEAIPDAVVAPESATPPIRTEAVDATSADPDPRQIFAMGRVQTPMLSGEQRVLPTDTQTLAQFVVDLPESGFDLKSQLEAIEQAWLDAALNQSDGVVAQAARLLGIRRTTLVEKLRKYQMSFRSGAQEEA